MRKSKKDYLTYVIATAKPTDQLDRINRLGGCIYSKTLSLAFKTHRRKGFWISDGGLKAYLKFKRYPCHSHSVQAIIDDYCGARGSYFENRKTNPNAKPPHKTRKFHTFTWRATGISYERGKLRLLWGKVENPFRLGLIRSSIRKCQPKSHSSITELRNNTSSMQPTSYNRKKRKRNRVRLLLLIWARYTR